ncbi:MAG TPA: hypothetical protein VF074_05570 [Pyrinomonadaceae bacterium]
MPPIPGSKGNNGDRAADTLFAPISFTPGFQPGDHAPGMDEKPFQRFLVVTSLSKVIRLRGAETNR